MCGRIIDIYPGEIYEKRFRATFEGEPWDPRYNLAPSQLAPVILNTDPKKIIRSYWGILPAWLKEKGGRELINARAETILEKSTFRKMMERGRCLIISDGFYEWQKADRGKIPFLIRRRDKQPFAMAGLWQMREHEKLGQIPSFVIITTGPNDLMQPIHKRMPAILTQENEKEWLVLPEDAAQTLLKPFKDSDLEAFPVSTMVNAPANDIPELIQAA